MSTPSRGGGGLTSSYRANPALFAEFKSSRVRAAAGDMQARFAASISALGKFDQYQRGKAKEEGENEDKENEERAKRRADELQREVRLERSVMKPKLSHALFGEATSKADSTSQADTRSARPRENNHLSVSMLRSNVPSASTSTATSPVQSRVQPAHQPFTTLALPQATHHPNSHISYAHHESQPAPSLTPMYASSMPVRPPSRVAVVGPVTPPESPDNSAAEAQARIRHIQKAMGTLQLDDAQRKGWSQDATGPFSTRSQPTPRIHLKDAGPSVALPISRPVSVATVRKAVRSSPSSRSNSRHRSRSRSRRRKGDALPQHVARLLQIQSVHAARAGDSSSDSDDDAFQKRRARMRIPDSPVAASPSPSIRTYRASPKPSLIDEPPRRPASAASSRIPINRLAESMGRLAEQDDDSALLLRRPTLQALQQDALLAYEAPPKPSFAIAAPPPSSNVHIHMHGTQPTAFSENGHSSVSSLIHQADSRMAQSDVAFSMFPGGSPRMTTRHPASWASHSEQPTYSQQPNSQYYQRHPQQMQQQPYDSHHQSYQSQQSHQPPQPFFQPQLSHQSTVAASRPAANGWSNHANDDVASADAEFEVLHSMLQGAENPTHSRTRAHIDLSAPRPRQSIDNYHYPPKMGDQASEFLVTAPHDTAASHTQRGSNGSERRSMAPPETFHYTQTIYQPEHTRSHHHAQTQPTTTTTHTHDAWSSVRSTSFIPATFDPPAASSSLARSVYPPASSSVSARSFFQPNESPSRSSASDISRYPPVLRQQLQQQQAMERGELQATEHDDSAFRASLRSSTHRSRSSSPMRRPQSHLADTSLMSPSRLASYLQHYLRHRTQVEHASESTDPNKVMLTSAEERQLQSVIVDLNSLRSSHEVTKTGQQVVTTVKATHALSAADDAKPILSLKTVKRPAVRPASPRALHRLDIPVVPQPAPSRAAIREAHRQVHEEARLTDALLKIARDKEADSDFRRTHAKQVGATRKTSTIDTGLKKKTATTRPKNRI